MNIANLVKFFREGGSFETFCQANALNIESEVIEVYMIGPVYFENELSFFEIEKTEGLIEYESDDKIYYNLFDFYFFMDFIEESISNENMDISNEVIAKKLYRYAIQDA